MNRNAYVGRNVEQLFKNSIGDNMDVVKKIQVKLKMNPFVAGMTAFEIASYSI